MKTSSEIFIRNLREIRVNVDTPATELYRLNTPPLSSLNEPFINGVLVLQLLIIEILDFLGVEWSENQIQDCGELAYPEYYWFTIAELKQFSQRVKMGYFGKIYGKFSPSTLMEYFKDYAGDMLGARAEYYGNKKIEPPVAHLTPLTPEEQEIQDKYFKSLVSLAEKLCSPNSDQSKKEKRERDIRMARHMEFFKANLTPEQAEEINMRRKEIEEASKKYEEERKVK